ncbi:MAG: TetR/AcrR family transcriptional regulator [Wujia sp.]
MENKRISTTNILAKECIVSALLKLIYQKPLSAITISELCSVAGVSRMTFYRNYTSTEDIFKKHLDEIFRKYSDDHIGDKKDGHFYNRSNMVHYFSYLKSNREFMDALIYCGFGIYFMNKMDDYIMKKWGDSADEITLHAFTGSLFGVFQMWSRQHYKTDLNTLASQIESIYS